MSTENQVDLSIDLKLGLSAVNFILQTLDKNPLGGSVMEVATLIQAIRSQTQTQVDAAAAAEKAAKEAVTGLLGQTETKANGLLPKPRKTRVAAAVGQAVNPAGDPPTGAKDPIAG